MTMMLNLAGVNGMMGNQLFQLAALIGLASNSTCASSRRRLQVCPRLATEMSHLLLALTTVTFKCRLFGQVVVPDIVWTGREQERQRIFE